MAGTLFIQPSLERTLHLSFALMPQKVFAFNLDVLNGSKKFPCFYYQLRQIIVRCKVKIALCQF